MEEEDLELYVGMFCSPEHMQYLGGPVPPETAEKYLRAHMRCNTTGSGLVFKLVPEPEDWKGDEDTLLVEDAQKGVGTVCMWHSEHKGEFIDEIGWGIQPRFQGHGFGTKGVRLLLELAREQGDRWKNIRVFTDLRNEPSLHLCRRLGFEFLGECEVDYNGQMMQAHQFAVTL